MWVVAAGTSRKYLRGPRGAGFLYARKSALGPGYSAANAANAINTPSLAWEPAIIDVAGAVWTDRQAYRLLDGARRYEQFEMSFAAKIGLGAAVEYALSMGIERCWLRTVELASRLRGALREHVPGATVHDQGRSLCGIVTFTLQSHPDAKDVQSWLAGRATPINVSTSSRSSSLLDFHQRGLSDVLRASVSYFNTEEEIRALCDALRELVASAVGS